METKKSIPSAIAENVSQYEGANGKIYYHKITFQNGDSGQYGSKSPVCEKFKLGTEVDYTIETKVNGSYTNHIIKPVAPAFNGKGGGDSKYPPKDQGIITYLSCFSSACVFYASRLQRDSDEVLKLAEQGFNEAMKKSTLK